MAIETIIANVLGQNLAGFIRKKYAAHEDAKIKAMPYEEKRRAVIASQEKYLAGLKPRITWRYRLGRLIGRLIGRS